MPIKGSGVTLRLIEERFVRELQDAVKIFDNNVEGGDRIAGHTSADRTQ
jgi:hypothetical protein